MNPGKTLNENDRPTFLLEVVFRKTVTQQNQHKEKMQENERYIEEIIQENIKKEWINDLSRLLPVTHEKIYKHLVIGKSFGNETKRPLKHKINDYQLFKKGLVKY